MLMVIRRSRFLLLRNLRKPYNDFENPYLSSIFTDFSEFASFHSISARHFSLSAQFSDLIECIPKPKKQLSEIFESVTGQLQSPEKSEAEAEDVRGNAIKIESLRKLEDEVRNLNDGRIGVKLRTEKIDSAVRRIGSVNQNLSALFRGKETGKEKSLKRTNFGGENPDVHKTLSPDMELLAQHLHPKGYFKNTNFLYKKEFDIPAFQSGHSRESLKHAAVKFGKHQREIAKWLSASDLKKIALFGCPSIGQKTVLSSKIMRRYFGIVESKVCGNCQLKGSCKFAYEGYKHPVEQLDLSSVTRVLTTYALGLIPNELTVPEEVSASVSRLVKEIVNLS